MHFIMTMPLFTHTNRTTDAATLALSLWVRLQVKTIHLVPRENSASVYNKMILLY